MYDQLVYDRAYFEYFILNELSRNAARFLLVFFVAGIYLGVAGRLITVVNLIFPCLFTATVINQRRMLRLPNKQ